jgi:predicted RNA-binding Zn ribbon-like protein
VDFASYATFATDLVSSEPDELDPTDPLTSLEGLRTVLQTRTWIAEKATTRDLAPLVALRGELRQVFEAAHQDRPDVVVERLNHLLEVHPPQLSVSGHDRSDWHLHVADEHSPVAVQFTAGAVMGLAMAFLDLGPERFGTCADPRCNGVFIDTSRNRSRRYCSERCVSRANVAAHRQRQRSKS